MSTAAWAIEPGHFESATARETRPNDDAAPLAFALFGSEAYIGVHGLLTPMPILAIGPGGAAIPIGTSYAQIAVAVAHADADDRVESIRIMMDSPGGMVDGVRRAMASIRDCVKPTTVQVDGACCSAAYWLASAADRIEAQSTSSIGCLGVMLSKADLPKGERRFISSQTPAKVPDPRSDHAEQYQAIVDDFAGQLLDDVAANRGRDRAKVAADFGSGATLPARAALAVGLIDAIIGPAVGSGRPDGVRAVAQESTDPGDREKEGLMGLPIPGEMSREELETELMALRAGAMDDAEDEHEAVDADIEEDAEKLLDEELEDAGAVAADIELNRLRAALATAESKSAVLALHVQGARAAERGSRIDALITSGRIGTTDNDRAIAEHLYDAEAKATQAYAMRKGVTLATASQAQSKCRLFSALEGKAAGAANVGLSGSSVGGKPFAGPLNASLSTAAGFAGFVADYCAANAGANTAAAVDAFRTNHRAEYIEVMKGAN